MAANVSHTTDFVPLPATKGQVPSCSHGPALLFERFDKSHKAVRQFFACSAFRDRKACDFFKWAEGPVSKLKSLPEDLTPKQSTHKEMRKRFKTFKKLKRQDRHVCCSCGLLLLPVEVEHHKAQGHVLNRSVGLQSLKRASSLFQPLENNKTFAQYLFSKSTVNFIIQILCQLPYTHVLCVGVPRIHEEIQCMKKDGNSSLNSFLLDLDDRYAQVYPSSVFSKYNMFNHHFFEDEGRLSVCNFLVEAGDKAILITDPPFGGMVEPLGRSLVELSHLRDEDEQTCERGCSQDPKECKLPLLWFFPYFMESRISDCLSNVSMLDYKVEYDNHSLYKNSAKKRGSPVRMFTNLCPSLVKLPADEGYWFCKDCQRYCSAENWHCLDCGSCTSKDGSRYVHCDICHRCVKPSRIHCQKCGSCQTQDHICGQVLSEGCYICGEMDHKRRDCPKKSSAQGAEPAMKKQRCLKRSSKSPNSHVKKRKM